MIALSVRTERFTLRAPLRASWGSVHEREVLVVRLDLPDGLWGEEFYTGTGFPRVFYLRYHGYAKFFPLWALARYRNLQRGNSRKVAVGM